MNKFKVGDLVMVTKPTICCGKTGSIGYIFLIGEVSRDIGDCSICGKSFFFECALDNKDGLYTHTSRLIKIDPPATGETREAYKELTA